jgi:GNAT superfamily N-acetyltransferase
LGLRIEPLAQHHDRAGFSCGRPDLDRWFRLQASQEAQQNVTRVFVAIDAEWEVVGFYSLTTLSLSLENLPEEVARQLPRPDAIPVALISRLARDKRVRGQGLGEILLADAIHRILGACRSVAALAIVADAKDGDTVDFFEAFGFQPFPLRPGRLFLLTATAVAGLAPPN